VNNSASFLLWCHSKWWREQEVKEWDHYLDMQLALLWVYPKHVNAYTTWPQSALNDSYFELWSELMSWEWQRDSLEATAALERKHHHFLLKHYVFFVPLTLLSLSLGSSEWRLWEVVQHLPQTAHYQNGVSHQSESNWALEFDFS